VKKVAKNFKDFLDLKRSYDSNKKAIKKYKEAISEYDKKHIEYLSCIELDSLCRISKLFKVTDSLKTTLYQKYKKADSLYTIALRKKWIEDSTKYRIQWIKDSTEKSLQFKKILQNNTEVGNLQYFLQSNTLGYINCDFFANFTGPKCSLKFTPNDKNTNIKLVFANRMVVMQPANNANEFVFANIPIGEEVIVVALNYEFEQPSYFKETIKVKDSTTPIPIILKKCSVDELKKEVKKLD